MAFLNCKLLSQRNPKEVKSVVCVLIRLNSTATNAIPKKISRIIREIYIIYDVPGSALSASGVSSDLILTTSPGREKALSLYFN